MKFCSQTEETPEELNHRMIVLPDQRNKLQWDAGISMVCVLVAVLSPYRMAFAPIDAKRWLVFDALVDIFFVIGEIRWLRKLEHILTTCIIFFVRRGCARTV